MGARWRIHGAGSVDFSVQYLVNCASEPFPGRGNTGCHGCDGGSSYGAYAHARAFGAVDSACLPYAAVTQNCTAAHICEQNLDSHGPGPAPATPRRHFAAEYGAVGVVQPRSNNDPVTPTPAGNEAAMQKEIFARGPISCCMACPAEFESGYVRQLLLFFLFS